MGFRNGIVSCAPDASTAELSDQHDQEPRNFPDSEISSVLATAADCPLLATVRIRARDQHYEMDRHSVQESKHHKLERKLKGWY